MKYLILVLSFLFVMCEKFSLTESESSTGDGIIVIAPGFIIADSVWITRIVGSRHRIDFRAVCNSVQYRWYESTDADSFYLKSTTQQLIFGLDRYYYAEVLCNKDTLRTDTIIPCDGLTAYFDYIPDPDCTSPYSNIIKPRVGLLNNCTVDSIEIKVNDVVFSGSQITATSDTIYTLIFHCLKYGCSDTLTFTYLQSSDFKLSKSGGFVLLDAPPDLVRSDVTWYSKHPTIGGWGESTGTSYTTYKAKARLGYRYYARVQYKEKIYFTDIICN